MASVAIYARHVSEEQDAILWDWYGRTRFWRRVRDTRGEFIQGGTRCDCFLNVMHSTVFTEKMSGRTVEKIQKNSTRYATTIFARLHTLSSKKLLEKRSVRVELRDSIGNAGTAACAAYMRECKSRAREKMPNTIRDALEAGTYGVPDVVYGMVSADTQCDDHGVRVYSNCEEAGELCESRYPPNTHKDRGEVALIHTVRKINKDTDFTLPETDYAHQTVMVRTRDHYEYAYALDKEALCTENAIACKTCVDAGDGVLSDNIFLSLGMCVYEKKRDAATPISTYTMLKQVQEWCTTLYKETSNLGADVVWDGTLPVQFNSIIALQIVMEVFVDICKYEGCVVMQVHLIDIHPMYTEKVRTQTVIIDATTDEPLLYCCAHMRTDEWTSVYDTKMGIVSRAMLVGSVIPNGHSGWYTYYQKLYEEHMRKVELLSHASESVFFVYDVVCCSYLCERVSVLPLYISKQTRGTPLIIFRPVKMSPIKYKTLTALYCAVMVYIKTNAVLLKEYAAEMNTYMLKMVYRPKETNIDTENGYNAMYGVTYEDAWLRQIVEVPDCVVRAGLEVMPDKKRCVAIHNIKMDVTEEQLVDLEGVCNEDSCIIYKWDRCYGRVLPVQVAVVVGAHSVCWCAGTSLGAANIWQWLVIHLLMYTKKILTTTVLLQNDYARIFAVQKSARAILEKEKPPDQYPKYGCHGWPVNCISTTEVQQVCTAVLQACGDGLADICVRLYCAGGTDDVVVGNGSVVFECCLHTALVEQTMYCVGGSTGDAAADAAGAGG